MAFHQIEPERASLHGPFSRELAPCLTIQSGDTVRFRTLDAGWNIEPRTSTDISVKQRKFEPREAERDKGHALCGPVFIEDAQPGMTLEVQIGVIQPGTWGWTSAGGWSCPLNDRLGVADGDEILHLWALEPEKGIGRNQHGHQVRLRPFMGIMGMPPDAPGRHSTSPPRMTGGNIDCKELVSGSSLFLPIAVLGGLFSTGDGHAAQGDGEVASPAIECPMETVELTFHLHPEMSLTTPRAVTPAGRLTLGFGETLEDAMGVALAAMLDWMQELYELSRKDALALASLVVDLRITQVVNGIKGVHALLPPDALTVH